MTAFECILAITVVAFLALGFWNSRREPFGSARRDREARDKAAFARQMLADDCRYGFNGGVIYHFEKALARNEPVANIETYYKIKAQCGEIAPTILAQRPGPEPRLERASKRPGY